MTLLRDHRVEIGLILTAHKVQGKTFPAIILDLNDRVAVKIIPAINFQALHVILSRITDGSYMKLLPLRNQKNPIESLKYLLDIDLPLDLYIWRAGYAKQGSSWDESLSRAMYEKIMSRECDSKAVIPPKNSLVASTNKNEVVNSRKKPLPLKKGGAKFSDNKSRTKISKVQSSSSTSSSSSSYSRSLMATNKLMNPTFPSAQSSSSSSFSSSSFPSPSALDWNPDRSINNFQISSGAVDFHGIDCDFPETLYGFKWHNNSCALDSIYQCLFRVYYDIVESTQKMGHLTSRPNRYFQKH